MHGTIDVVTTLVDVAIVVFGHAVAHGGVFAPGEGYAAVVADYGEREARTFGGVEVALNCKSGGSEKATAGTAIDCRYISSTLI